MQRSHQHACQNRHHQSGRRILQVERGGEAKARAYQHHPLDTDVDHTGTFAQDAGQRTQRNRRCQANPVGQHADHVGAFACCRIDQHSRQQQAKDQHQHQVLVTLGDLRRQQERHHAGDQQQNANQQHAVAAGDRHALLQPRLHRFGQTIHDGGFDLAEAELRDRLGVQRSHRQVDQKHAENQIDHAEPARAGHEFAGDCRGSCCCCRCHVYSSSAPSCPSRAIRRPA